MELLTEKVSVIVLAAGQSKRMKQSKIVLPWGSKTIIATIINSFQQVGIDDIVVVTGGYQKLVEEEVFRSGARVSFNPNFENDEMIFSLQVGLNSINKQSLAAFVALGDQPDLSLSDLHKMLELFEQNPLKIIIPSFNMHRGHPWLVPQIYFPQLLQITPPDTMRTFLNNNEKNLQYYLTESSAILTDLDTPEDYAKLKPKY